MKTDRNPIAIVEIWVLFALQDNFSAWTTINSICVSKPLRPTYTIMPVSHSWCYLTNPEVIEAWFQILYPIHLIQRPNASAGQKIYSHAATSIYSDSNTAM